MRKYIEVNDWIDKFSEMKPHLDQILENTNVEEVYIKNDGCKQSVINRMIKYINNHDCIATVSLNLNKGY